MDAVQQEAHAAGRALYTHLHETLEEGRVVEVEDPRQHLGRRWPGIEGPDPPPQGAFPGWRLGVEFRLDRSCARVKCPIGYWRVGWPGEGGPDAEVCAPTAIDEVVHDLGCACCAVSLAIIFEVVGIPGHHQGDLVLPEQVMELAEGWIARPLCLSTGKKRMPKQDHRELSLRAFESRFEPGPLPVVEAPEDTGVAGDEGESLAVYFEEWRPLEAGLHVVLPPQLGGLSHEPLNARLCRTGQWQVSFKARPYGGSGCIGLEEVAVDAVESGEPVMVAGNGVDGLLKTFERQVKVELVVLHRARRVNDV